jgi:hypothetical protein
MKTRKAEYLEKGFWIFILRGSWLGLWCFTNLKFGHGIKVHLSQECIFSEMTSQEHLVLKLKLKIPCMIWSLTFIIFYTQFFNTMISIKIKHLFPKPIFFLYVDGLWFMVFNTTFNNISIISWRSVLLMEVPGENHRPITSH